TNTERQNILSETTVKYMHSLKEFNLDLLAGFSYQEEKFSNYFFSKDGFPDDDIRTLNAGVNITDATSTATEWTMLSYFGRLNVDYQDKYALTASLRRDGSSRFGQNNKW